MSINRKTNAVLLRKKGFSYSQISRSLNIAKSTLSFWLKDLKISSEAQKRIKKRAHDISIKALIKRNQQQTQIAHDRSNNIRAISAAKLIKLTQRDIFILGLALYWGEGYKKGAYGSKWKCVDFANSDPETVKYMMRFFLEHCNVNIKKIKAQIMIHSTNDTAHAEKYWQGITKIPREQFIKTTIIKRNKRAKSTYNKLNYGTIHIRIYSVDTFFKIIGWIDGLRKIINHANTSGIV